MSGHEMHVTIDWGGEEITYDLLKMLRHLVSTEPTVPASQLHHAHGRLGQMTEEVQRLRRKLDASEDSVKALTEHRDALLKRAQAAEDNLKRISMQSHPAGTDREREELDRLMRTKPGAYAGNRL